MKKVSKNDVRAALGREGTLVRKIENKLLDMPRARITQKPRPRSTRKPGSGVALNGPPVINSLPRIQPKITMRPGPDHNSVKVSIVDYVGPLVVDEETPARGTLLYNESFSPSSIPGSKISTIATMYERYVVNRLVFHYSAACPTTVGGALIMAFDKDPGDVTYSGEPGIRHAIGLSSMTQFAPWEHASLIVQKENQQTFYYTSAGEGPNRSDGRLVYMGSMFVIATTPGSIVAEQSLGDIWVEAEITFYDPTWEPTDINAVVANPTDGGHTMSLISQEGFLGVETDSTLEETNISFQRDGRLVGLNEGAVGFVVPANNRFHITDSFIGCATTVRLTGETLTAFPFLDGYDTHLGSDSLGHGLAFQPDFEASDTSATQTNWLATFTVTLPNSVSLSSEGYPTGWHRVDAWYVVSNLIGTVGGTYTGRSVSIQRDAAYSRFNDLKRSRKVRHPKAKMTPTVMPASSSPPKDGKVEVIESGEVPRPVTPGKGQWVKFQISS